MKPKLTDVVAAFKFSRLPREERMAQLIEQIIENNVFSGLGPESIRMITSQLEPYAKKDFAVRYGHLDDGKN